MECASMDATALLDLLGRVRDGDQQAAAELLRDNASQIDRFIRGRLSTSAAAQLYVGSVHEVVGEMAKAEAAYRRALSLEPSSPLAIARLASLLRGNLPSADRTVLETRLADRRLARDLRAQILFARAKMFDADGDYAGAADCLAEANSLRLEARSGHGEYSPEQHRLFVDGLIRAFDRDFFAKTGDAETEHFQPVFVVGLPRSGTSLIEQILASHSRIHGAGELALAQRSFEAIPRVLGRASAPIDCANELDARAAALLARHYREEINRLNRDQRDRVIDKMPENYLYLGLLAAMFPRAVFIHCCRNLRDTAVSCWMTDFSSLRWTNCVEHIAGRFREYRRMMDHWREVLPSPIHEVDYEAVVANTEAVARRLVAVCGLEWEPACLEFHRTARPVQSASVAQVREPIYCRSIDRWKNYERPLATLFAALSDSDRDVG